MSGSRSHVALVVVSHSAALAEAAVELAQQMVAEDPPVIEIAAGHDGGLGTDAVAIAAAVAAADRANDGAGVLVLSDLGSAVLSSEMALELVDPEPSGEVLLSRAPLVEGLVAAAVQASAGAALAQVEAEAVRAISAKAEQLGDAPSGQTVTSGAREHGGQAEAEHSVEVEVVNAQGLHARPAARFVAAAAALPVDVRVLDLTAGTGPVTAASMLELMTLGAGRGHVLRLSASGPGAPAALNELRHMITDGLGEG